MMPLGQLSIPGTQANSGCHGLPWEMETASALVPKAACVSLEHAGIPGTHRWESWFLRVRVHFCLQRGKAELSGMPSFLSLLPQLHIYTLYTVSPRY